MIAKTLLLRRECERQPVRLIPKERGTEPRYQALNISPDEKRGQLKLFMSPDGHAGSIKTRAAASVHAATLDGDEQVEHELGTIPKAWVQVARGSLSINGKLLSKGDGVAIDGGGRVTMNHGDDSMRCQNRFHVIPYALSRKNFMTMAAVQVKISPPSGSPVRG